MEAGKIKILLPESSVSKSCVTGAGFVEHSGIIHGKQKNSYEQMKRKTKKLIDSFFT